MELCVPMTGWEAICAHVSLAGLGLTVTWRMTTVASVCPVPATMEAPAMYAQHSYIKYTLGIHLPEHTVTYTREFI